ncbi:MAG: hypothetical protein HGB11_03850 [Chlorobiales bacterium]|nr:hypothetical protein [Chlorobiales bacterium]
MRSKIQGIAKGFWRLIEVYLFFIVSVFGGHIIAKSIFSHTSKAKDKAAERRFYLLSKSLLPVNTQFVPSEAACQAVRYGFVSRESAIEKGSFAQRDAQGGFALSQSPFISALQFYQLPEVVTDAPVSPLKSSLPQHVSLLQTPLLI